ncbi:MAG: aminotransferase class IV [Cyclobacteriaceae bacterium]
MKELIEKSPNRFIESILFENHHYPLLAFHQRRVDLVFNKYFPSDKKLDLKSILPQPNESEKVKVRLVYDGDGFTLSHERYQIRPINSLQLIEHNKVDYGFKYENRSKLDELFSERQACDDILIIKNNKITDSYYANPVFWDGVKWLAPKTYLLNGVRRQHLIETGQISERDIGLKDLQSFEKISLVNAMIDLGEVEISIDQVKI